MRALRAAPLTAQARWSMWWADHDPAALVSRWRGHWHLFWADVAAMGEGGWSMDLTPSWRRIFDDITSRLLSRLKERYMATKCRCGAAVVTQTIQTKVPGTTAVAVTICPRCDRRQCRGCKEYEPTGTAMACPHCGRAMT